MRRWHGSLLLLGIALAGCGGSDRPPGAPAVTQLAPPVAATNMPPGTGVIARPGQAPRTGIVEGAPSLDILRQVRPPDSEALAAGSASCGNVRALPSAGNLSQQSRTILCLLNAERRARGLSALRLNARLTRASVSHSADMVANRYFAHDARNGRSMGDRLRAVRYVSPTKRFMIGENLAWGTGQLATPEALIDAWMRSPGHRANILQPRYREVGVGIRLGAPKAGAGDPAVTVTTDFGHVG